MAYVKILNIRSKSGIGNATKYVENEEKTNKENYKSTEKQERDEEGIVVGTEDGSINSAIDNLVGYTTQDIKTDDKLLVTGINCTTHHAAEEMQSMVDYWKKERRIEGVSRDAFHIIQSFDPKDNPKITPETIHEIGLKYAEALQHMDDKNEVNRHYMMLVSTHIDKEHLHNHIILCSYDMNTGKKFHECKDVYRQMREASDRLCQEYGLSIIEEPDIGRSNSRAEIEHIKEGTSWKDNLRKDIDAMRSVSRNWDEFKEYMEGAGYQIKEGKYVTYTTPEEHKVRDKTLGREWMKENIEKYWQKEQDREAGISNTEARIKQFYKEDQELSERASLYSTRYNPYDEQGGRTSVLSMLLTIALEMMSEDTFEREIYFSNMNPVPTPEKEKEYRIKKISDTIEMAKVLGVNSEEELEKRLKQTGAALSHAQLQLKKNRATNNKMEVINNALQEYETVQETIDKINRYPEGPIKKDLQGKYRNELEKYKKSKSVLYRYQCSTPEQQTDFKERFERVKTNILELSAQVTALKTEYKNLRRVKYGIDLARDEGFLQGRFYNDVEAEMDRIQEPEKKKETRDDKDER